METSISCCDTKGNQLKLSDRGISSNIPTVNLSKTLALFANM